MSNRLALVIVAVAVPVAGFFLSQNQFFKLNDKITVENPAQPEPRDFSPIENPEPEQEPVAPARVRPDQAQFDRLSGTPISDIIATLKAESKYQSETPVDTSFADALPDVPFPFLAAAPPRDAAVLETFISTTQQGLVGDSTGSSRWKINLAHAALGTYPDGVPATLLIPDFLKPETELFPVQFIEINRLDCGDVFAVADFNSDGMDDLIGQGGTKLWKSLSADSIPTNLPAADGLFPADFDGDGDVDLFATRRNGLPNSLWINEGEGTFIEFTEGAGLLAFADSITAVWGDFNRDSMLDLAVGNTDTPLEVYLSNGDGTFEFDAEEESNNGPTNVAQLDHFDLDNDRLPELIITHADGSVVSKYSPSAISGLSLPSGESPGDVAAKFADFDNDGDLDSFMIRENSVAVFRNEGKGKFTNITAELNLPEISGIKSVALCDLDGDGFEDLHIGTATGLPDRAFWNRDGLAFREITAASGLGFVTETGTVAQTGTDLVIGGRVLQPATARLPRLTIHLEKNSAGATINLLTRDSDWVLQPIHRIANGYQPTVIGMGDAKIIESIQVIWPDAGTPPSSYSGKDIPLNSTIAIERGGDAVIVLDE